MLTISHSAGHNCERSNILPVPRWPHLDNDREVVGYSLGDVYLSGNTS